MNGQGRPLRAIFATSFDLQIAVWSAVFLCLLAGGIGTFFSNTYPKINVAFWLVLAALAFRQAMFYWSRPARRAYFYEDRAVFTGRNLLKEIPYSRILGVSKIKRLFTVWLVLVIEDEARGIEIWNPSNRKLKTDLDRWLSEKLETTKEPTNEPL